MVTTSAAKAVSQGATSGVTFGTVNVDTPESKLRSAAAEFLARNGMTTCTVGAGHELVRWQYEFTYSCMS